MKAISIVIVACAIALATAMIVSAALRPDSEPMSAVELALWQTLSLFLGLFGSYLFGRHSSHQAARKALRPYERTAFRRVLDLYGSLERLLTRIGHYNEQSPDQRLEIIHAIVAEQLETGNFALEDWRDIISEDVDEIIKRWQEQLPPRRSEDDDAS